MRGGRLWMLVGALVGAALAAGHFPFLAGAAHALADAAVRVVGTGGAKLISAVATEGAPQRVVLGITAVVAVLLPGVTSLLLVMAAGGAQLLRRLASVAIALLGVAAFFYQPAGIATGALVLGLAVAAAAVALTGPLVVAPLTALAALIGGEFLPPLLSRHPDVPNAPVSQLHQALFATPGVPLWLRVVVLVIAVGPFALAARLLFR